MPSGKLYSFDFSMIWFRACRWSDVELSFQKSACPRGWFSSSVFINSNLSESCKCFVAK